MYVSHDPSQPVSSRKKKVRQSVTRGHVMNHGGYLFMDSVVLTDRALLGHCTDDVI